MVPHAHVERGARLLREAEPDLAQADDAEHGAVGVVRYGGDVLVRVVELGGVAGAGREEGPGEGAVGGEEEEDGGVGDGFGACGGRVAVEDAVGGEGPRVDPVEAGAGAGVDLAGGGEEGAVGGSGGGGEGVGWGAWLGHGGD